MTSDNEPKQLNPETGEWERAIPEQYAYGFIQWLHLRLIGYRDEYGRKAKLWI